MEDFGADLARMPACLPDGGDRDYSDPDTLRWSVRSNGRSGFLFVNNYQRLQIMPAKINTNFRVNLPSGPLTLPSQPATIPADSFFYLPFHLDCNGVEMLHATAQPVCRNQDSDGGQTIVFAEIPGMTNEFAFDPQSLEKPRGKEALIFRGINTGRQPAFRIRGKNGKELRVILLSEEDSLALAGKTSDGRLIFDTPPIEKSIPVELEIVKNPESLHNWKSRNTDFPLPISPGHNNLQAAALWRVKLPADLDMSSNPTLKIHYTGDVARLILNGRLLNDDFYNGSAFEIGLKRYAPEIASGELLLAIFPLQKDMPVYFEPGCRPDFDKDGMALRIDRAEITSTQTNSNQMAQISYKIPLEK